VGEPRRSRRRASQRCAGGTALRSPRRREVYAGYAGAIPTKPRRTLRTCPKLSVGSSRWTRLKTSPRPPASVGSLCGSHHPWPLWFTMTISPGAPRYLRARRVLSALSSRHPGAIRSRTVAQLTAARSRSTSWSYPSIARCSCLGSLAVETGSLSAFADLPSHSPGAHPGPLRRARDKGAPVRSVARERKRDEPLWRAWRRRYTSFAGPVLFPAQFNRPLRCPTCRREWDGIFEGGVLSERLSIELQACDRARNRYRRWHLAAGQDLFGRWHARVTFGRIGCEGRTIRHDFVNEDDAAAFIRALPAPARDRRKKARHVSATAT
jgi:hypothetical protein